MYHALENEKTSLDNLMAIGLLEDLCVWMGG